MVSDNKRETASGAPPFAEWYESAAGPLTSRISAQVGDPVLGREVAAEAFARAYAKWDRVGQMDSPEGWIFRTATNLNRRSWRRRQIEKRALAKVAALETSAGPDVRWESVHVQGHEVDDLTHLVDGLPDQMRTAVRLRYWNQLPESEVARQMNTSEGSASATLSTARKRLRQRLGTSQEEANS